jgi:Glyoxalase/Bleomycin resistance protein/Dioxygenase superfamily
VAENRAGQGTMIGDLFVTGMVVPELEKAIDQTTQTLGVAFTPIQESPLQMRTAKGVEVFDLRFVYSLGRPPHLELIEGIPGGYYDPGAGYIRHVGLWVDDLAAASAELSRSGMLLEASGMNGDVEPYAFVFHAWPWGLRVELVDRVQQPSFEAWLAGEELQI